MPVRHVFFALLVALYVVVIGQNWAVYTAALLVALWIRYDGKLGSVPITIGKPRDPVGDGKDPDREEPHR